MDVNMKVPINVIKRMEQEHFSMEIQLNGMKANGTEIYPMAMANFIPTEYHQVSPK
jgi:hypothetical protein